MLNEIFPEPEMQGFLRTETARLRSQTKRFRSIGAFQA
jgi:hypothetical protein